VSSASDSAARLRAGQPPRVPLRSSQGPLAGARRGDASATRNHRLRTSASRSARRSAGSSTGGTDHGARQNQRRRRVSRTRRRPRACAARPAPRSMGGAPAAQPEERLSGLRSARRPRRVRRTRRRPRTRVAELSPRSMGGAPADRRRNGSAGSVRSAAATRVASQATAAAPRSQTSVAVHGEVHRLLNRRNGSAGSGRVGSDRIGSVDACGEPGDDRGPTHPDQRSALSEVRRQLDRRNGSAGSARSAAAPHVANQATPRARAPQTSAAAHGGCTGCSTGGTAQRGPVRSDRIGSVDACGEPGDGPRSQTSAAAHSQVRRQIDRRNGSAGSGRIGSGRIGSDRIGGLDACGEPGDDRGPA